MGINRARPGVDTPIQVDQRCARSLLQIVDDLLTANPVMTDDDDLTRRSQLLQLLRNFSHREINTAIDMTDLEFPGFSYIEQYRFFVFELRCQLRRIDSAHVIRYTALGLSKA